MDQTSIKTLYIFVEIAIDSEHLAKTIRLNFPNDRRRFHENLLDEEEDGYDKPGGTRSHLRIEGPSTPDTERVMSTSYERTRLALVSTIQFVAALQRLKEDLTGEYQGRIVPQQATGLLIASSGEVGTSPTHQSTDVLTKLCSGTYDATIPRSKPLSPGEILGCTAPRLNEVDALMYASIPSKNTRY